MPPPRQAKPLRGHVEPLASQEFYEWKRQQRVRAVSKLRRRVTTLVVDHRSAVVVAFVERRVEYRQAAAFSRNPPRFVEHHLQIRGVMQRSVEHDDVELRVVDWECVE